MGDRKCVEGYNSKLGWSVPSAKKQCINQCIFKHVNVLLNKLSDVFILEGNLASESYCRNTEKKWNEMLNEEQLQILQKDSVIVLAMALIPMFHTKDVQLI